jgi:hypothetical protein
MKSFNSEKGAERGKLDLNESPVSGKRNYVAPSLNVDGDLSSLISGQPGSLGDAVQGS